MMIKTLWVILLYSQVSQGGHIVDVRVADKDPGHSEIIHRVNNMKNQLDDKYELYKKKLNFVVESFQKNILDLQTLYKNPIKDDTMEMSLFLEQSTVNATVATECLTSKTKRLENLLTEGNIMYDECAASAASEELDAEMTMVVHEKNEFDNFVVNNLHSCEVDIQYTKCFADLRDLVEAEMRRINQYMINTLRSAQNICEMKPKNFSICTNSIASKLLIGKEEIMRDLKKCLLGHINDDF